MNRTLPLSVAVAVGLAVAIAIALVPMWRIEAVVSDTGLPAFLSIAEPPLGWTARAALMLFAALAVAVPVALPSSDAVEEEAPPSVRRADAHPDAPPRPPVRAARDLGQPFLDPVVPPEPELALPRDLDTPMAMFDPEALPMVPAAPPPTVRPLFRPAVEPEPQPVAEAEFPPPSPEEPVADPVQPAPSLSALIDRLDQGLQRRRGERADPGADAANAGLASALGALRRMARGE